MSIKMIIIIFYNIRKKKIKYNINIFSIYNIYITNIHNLKLLP